MVSAIITNNRKVLAISILSLVLTLSLALSTTAAFSWYGNVTIGTNSTTDGAKIGAYIGSSATANAVQEVGAGSFADGQYVITAGCSAGDAVFLKVWGINATAGICELGPATGNNSNLSVSLVASGGSCTYSQACSDTNYFCCSGSTEVNDGSTTGATCKSTCAAATTPTSGSGSGGSSGGGGGGSALKSESSTPVTISGSGSKDLSFTKTVDIAVSNVELTTTAAAAITNGKVTVKETKVSSGISSGVAKGNTKVYKYLSITKQNIKSEDLEKAKITFEVSFGWINSNNIDPDSVKLNRYVKSEWVTLNTKRLGKANSRGYVYEAETPDFSIFAVSGEKRPDKLTAFQLIDIIEAFYADTSPYNAFQVIDLIEKFYADA